MGFGCRYGFKLNRIGMFYWAVLEQILDGLKRAA
jgi:hypothetical protein